MWDPSLTVCTTRIYVLSVRHCKSVFTLSQTIGYGVGGAEQACQKQRTQISVLQPDLRRSGVFLREFQKKMTRIPQMGDALFFKINIMLNV